MIYLATNFDIVYEPSQTFRPEEAEDTSANSRNTTGYSDEELYRLAADMKQTKPGFFPPEEPEQTHGNHTFFVCDVFNMNKNERNAKNSRSVTIMRHMEDNNATLPMLQ